MELNALFLCVVNFFKPRGKLLFRSAINDGGLRADALGAACRVHRHVAAAHDNHLVWLRNGCFRTLLERLHEVDARQKLVGGVYAARFLAGDVHKRRKPRAAAHENGFKTFFFNQLIHGGGFAYHKVCANGYAELFEVFDFIAHDGFRKTKFRDAVNQHAARLMKRLVNRYLVTHARKLARAGKARGAGTDDRYLMAVFLRHNRFLFGVCHIVIRHEALEPADADRLALDAAHAKLLTLLFLRAYPPAYSGHQVGFVDLFGGADKVALFDEGNKIRYRNAHRAAFHARSMLAVQAAVRLVYRVFARVAKRDLRKVRVPYGGFRLWNGCFYV